MIKNTLTILALTLLLLASCSKTSPYNTNDVNIDINIKQIGYTYLEVEFTPSKDAYFYAGVIPWTTDGPMLDSVGTHFATLVLDSAQIEYMKWRRGLLIDMVPDIASFADHVLQYGKTDKYFTQLLMVKAYLVFAFVVDPDRMKPVGKVFRKLVYPEEKGLYNVSFDLTIDGYWDFTYPVDSLGQIVSSIPYYVMCASSDQIKNDTLFGRSGPSIYFAAKMAVNDVIFKEFLGISMRQHTDPFDSIVPYFEEGKTYYIGVASCDAMYSYNLTTLDQLNVYRIDWHGKDTYLQLYHDRDTLGFDRW